MGDRKAGACVCDKKKIFVTIYFVNILEIISNWILIHK